MDLLIENGDFARNLCGAPIEIYSIDEACQRVKLILSVKRGSFIYDRTLGADLSPLKTADTDNLNKQAQLLCREALADVKSIEIGEVSAEISLGKINLDVEVIFDEQIKHTEVTVSAGLY